MKSIVAFCFLATCVYASPLLHQNPSGRIIGGKQAKNGQFPWQVAVYFDTPDGSFFCGGALIDPKWVLTAGHCAYMATVFTLRFGGNSISTNDNYTVILGASYSETHPDYDPETLVNDIAMIRIDSEYDFNERIQVIPLAQTPLAANSDVTISGWGATGDWDGANPDLLYVQLTALDNDVCTSTYGMAPTDDMVCAVGKTTEGICSGDGGGPLVQYDSSGAAVHVGVASWASVSGCETDHPSGFTRTASYLEWINFVMSD